MMRLSKKTLLSIHQLIAYLCHLCHYKILLRRFAPLNDKSGWTIVKLILFIALMTPVFAFSETKKAKNKPLNQYTGIIHVHSRFSSGRNTIEELALLAKEKGIDVLVMTDHDLIRMEYGLPPFQNILKIPVNKSSVIKNGIKDYLDEINHINDQYKDVVLIPGVESSPFYYWTGNPINGNLTSHNWRKHLLIIGLDKIGDYKELPILHNHLSTRYVPLLIDKSIFFLASALLSLFLIKSKGLFKIMGIFIFLVSALSVINYHPFKSSPFTQYRGDQKEKPYQELIDYINERGGLSFFAHPESNVTRESYYGIGMETKKYTSDLIHTTGYTGFEAAYEDTIHFTDPEGDWDKILLEYCDGTRKSPIWGIGGLDYHGKDQASFGNIMTVFLAPQKNRQEILKSLKNGKTYSLRKSKNYYLTLNQFSVTDSSTKQLATMGEEISSSGNVSVRFEVSFSDKISRDVTVELIRSGKLAEKFSGKTPLKKVFKDGLDSSKNKNYYRLFVKSQDPHYIVSNPIFVKPVQGSH